METRNDKNISVLGLVLLSLLLSSCSSNQLSHTWLDQAYVSRPFKTVLVVAVRKNQSTRQAWEDGFAKTLAGHGVDVTSSYRIFPESLPDTNLIDTLMHGRSFDGIILVGRASTETINDVASNYNLTNPAFSSHPWEASYYSYYIREYYPGYPLINEVVKDEIKVWDTHEGARMIWTGIGEVEGSDARDDARSAIIQLIVPELVKQGVIAPRS